MFLKGYWALWEHPTDDALQDCPVHRPIAIELEPPNLCWRFVNITGVSTRFGTMIS